MKVVAELTILVFLFLFSIPPLLVRKFSQDKHLKRPFWQFNDYNSVAIALVCLFISIVALNVVEPQPDISTPEKQIDFGKRRGIKQHEQVGYERKMLAQPDNLYYNFKALEVWNQNLEARRIALPESFFSRSTHPEDYYTRLLESPDSALKDAAHFGIAALRILRNSSKLEAEENIAKISDQSKPCIQYLKALMVEKTSPSSAVRYYKDEINNKGNIEQSVEWLSGYYYYNNDILSLINLNTHPYSSPYLSVFYKQFLAFRNNHYLEFLRLEFDYCFTKWNISGIVGAILIFLVWIFYILSIDVYERERIKHIVFTIVSSCVLTILISYYYHYEHVYLDINRTGELMNDFLYYTIGVGLPEEIVKIIPVLILLQFTKAINEPLDYIIFGSLSALSFAFVENTFYFDEDGLYNIHARALWTSVSHAADTCIITYCLMFARWHPAAKGITKNKLVMFGIGLTIASLSHGMYDFFLGKQFTEVWIIPFFIVLTSIVVYTSMINNGINNSPFYIKSKTLNTDRLGSLLASLLLGVIIFEYVCISYIYGISTGNEGLVMSLLTSWYLLLFLAMRLTGIDIFPGRWEKLKFLSSVNPVAIIMRKKINYANYIGKELLINGGRKNAVILKYLPLKGKIVRREAVSDYTGWMVVDIDKPITVGKKDYKQIWIRTSEENVPIINNSGVEVKLWILPESSHIKDEKTEADLIYIDRVLVN